MAVSDCFLYNGTAPRNKFFDFSFEQAPEGAFASGRMEQEAFGFAVKLLQNIPRELEPEGRILQNRRVFFDEPSIVFGR